MTIAALVVTAGASARTNGPFSSNRHILPGTMPSWTTAAPQTAAVPSGTLVRAQVWLTPRNADQLDALAQAVSDPSSAQYGQYISADQYDAQYAPTADQVSQVTQWLTQAGLNIEATGPDNHFVAVAGSASAIANAFGTSLADYLVNGKQAQAPVADASVPDSLAGLVMTVTGLSTLGHVMKPADFGAPAAFVNATPCSRFVRRPVGEDAAAVPAPDASVRGVRLHAGPAARRLRRRRARQHAEPRPRRDRGDHGRIRRADAARRREPVRATSGRPAVLARAVPGPERARGRVDRRRVRRQRLVRRADARRRGRARDGSRRERPLLRRRELLRRRPDGPVGPDRPRQQGVDRDQLVGLADVLRRQQREPRLSRGSRDNRRLRGGLQAGRRAGDRVHVLLRRRG